MDLTRLQEKFQGKQVLITGGLGMIGSTIAHILVKCGAEVTIIDACIEPYGANQFNIESIKKQVHLSITDIRDRESIKTLVKGKDIIFNLAGQVSHNDSIKDPFLDADINYIGHLNVLENVKLHAPDARILYSGSRLQFGSVESCPVNEEQPLNPKTPYAFNKTVAENMYRYYSDVHGIDTVCFRIANPYGVRGQMKHPKYSIINFFIRQALEGKQITIFGDGDQLRDYIFVEDLANAFVLASIEESAARQVLNVGSGTGTKFKDMIGTILEVVGKGEVLHTPWPENYLNVETGDYITDIGKITGLLDWQPEVDLEEGIKRTVAYYQENLSRYV